MVMVVGDIVNYSTISQMTGRRLIAESLYTLWGKLDELLRAHYGTLSNYAGDALYAVWDLQTHPQAHGLAIDFTLAANRLVDDLGAALPLRDANGLPIRMGCMGCSVVHGSAAQPAMARSVAAILGDSTNLAFRLAGIAGREGLAAVIVTDKVHDAVQEQYVWGVPEEVAVKGRRGKETVFPVVTRQRSLASDPP